MTAKKAVMKPAFRSRVERDRKAESKRNPNDGHEWVQWEDQPIEKDKGDE